MKCRKEIVLTGYRVQYIDLQEPKSRTPKEAVHVMDRKWLDALALTGQSATGNIRDQYEQAGYKVFSVEAIKPKRRVELDLRQLWEQTAPATTNSEVHPE